MGFWLATAVVVFARSSSLRGHHASAPEARRQLRYHRYPITPLSSSRPAWTFHKSPDMSTHTRDTRGVVTTSHEYESRSRPAWVSNVLPSTHNNICQDLQPVLANGCCVSSGSCPTGCKTSAYLTTWHWSSETGSDTHKTCQVCEITPNSTFFSL